MGDTLNMEDVLCELEQTTATLGFIQTAFAEGSSCVNMEEASSAIYMLYWKQIEVIKKMKEMLSA